MFTPAALAGDPSGYGSSHGQPAWVHALEAWTVATAPMPVQAPVQPRGVGEKGPPVPHQGQGPQDRWALPCKPTGAGETHTRLPGASHSAPHRGVRPRVLC